MNYEVNNVTFTNIIIQIEIQFNTNTKIINLQWQWKSTVFLQIVYHVIITMILRNLILNMNNIIQYMYIHIYLQFNFFVSTNNYIHFTLFFLLQKK